MPSESIEDPDEPSSSRRRVVEDPDWVAPEAKTKKPPKPATFSVTNLKQRDWIKSIVKSANRAKLSSDDIFFIFGDFFTAHGVDLDDVVFSPSTISQVRAEYDRENAATIKVSPQPIGNRILT